MELGADQISRIRKAHIKLFEIFSIAIKMYNNEDYMGEFKVNLLIKTALDLGLNYREFESLDIEKTNKLINNLRLFDMNIIKIMSYTCPGFKDEDVEQKIKETQFIVGLRHLGPLIEDLKRELMNCVTVG